MNIVGVLSGKRKCLLAIAIAFSTFGNAQLVTYPEGLNTGMPHNDDYTVKVREAGGALLSITNNKGDLPRTFQFFLSSYFLLFTYGSAY